MPRQNQTNQVPAKMTRSEAARIGGQACARRYGTEYMREIGRRGGQIGGQTVFARYGSEYMSNLGLLGADARYDILSNTAAMKTQRNLRRIRRQAGV